MIKDYGERKCLVCKAAFEAAYPGQVCCSDTCKKKRELALSRDNDARGRQRRKEEQEMLKNRVARLEAELKERDETLCELAKAKAAAEDALKRGPGRSPKADPAEIQHLRKKVQSLTKENQELSEQLRACGALL